MATANYNSAYSSIYSHKLKDPLIYKTRTRKGIIKVNLKESKLSESNAKRANLSASKKERIKLPNYDDGGANSYHISEFFSHPFGIESILNKRALQSCQSLDSNVYRCTLQPLQLLNFEVAPVLDLQVIPTSEVCRVEMLSCKV